MLKLVSDDLFLYWNALLLHSPPSSMLMWVFVQHLHGWEIVWLLRHIRSKFGRSMCNRPQGSIIYLGKDLWILYSDNLLGIFNTLIFWQQGQWSMNHLTCCLWYFQVSFWAWMANSWVVQLTNLWIKNVTWFERSRYYWQDSRIRIFFRRVNLIYFDKDET